MVKKKSYLKVLFLGDNKTVLAPPSFVKIFIVSVLLTFLKIALLTPSLFKILCGLILVKLKILSVPLCALDDSKFV